MGVILTIALAEAASSATPETLSGTAQLPWPEEDLSERMMNGAHAFIERRIDESIGKRGQHWNYDLSSAEAYLKSIEANRERFRKMIGVVDERAEPRMEFFGDDQNPALAARGANHTIHQARWQVLDGFAAEGLLIRPFGKWRTTVILWPDANTTPESYAGLDEGLPESEQIGRLLGEQGIQVLIPTPIDRRKLETKDSRLARSDQTHREWIYRQAFHMGRHVIGYEAQTTLAAVDWATRQAPERPIYAFGHGEGGLIAFYSAAADPRIAGALIAGYLGDRQRVWSEPIYRNVFGLLNEFDDARIISLIQPRRMLAVHNQPPTVVGHKGDAPAPGFAEVARVIAGAPRIRGGASTPTVVTAKGSRAALPLPAAVVARFLKDEGFEIREKAGAGAPKDLRRNFDPAQRHARIFKGMESHVQGLIRKSEHVRDRFFLFNAEPEFEGGRWSTNKEHPVKDPGDFIEKAKAFRKRFHEEAMGRFDEKMLPPNARTRKIAETDKWTAYDVVLDVYPELFAWGALVLPKDLKPGERRPVVVCQHGRNGLPRDAINTGSTAYNDFAARLAERGFITFAPHNLYRGEDRYRWLDRKANTVGCTLFSFIIAQHEQILKWLKTQPFVDGERMAFYGLSYGGETAVRVPAILEDYRLSICSGDFNQWTRKVAATDQPFSFMRTIEWEMPYWNLGHTFDYAEMAYLIFPRPFMVERGHHDRVGRDRWVAHEYAKVRWLYAQFGLADRTEIEYFQGGHSINGQGTFDFLHKHLDWPKPN